MIKNSLIILILGFIISGCSATENLDFLDNTECGNGIIEEGETQETCCLDVGCSNYHECNKKEEKSSYFCEKKKLEDTQEYKRFMQHYNESMEEYDSDNTNYNTIKVKTNSMKRELEELKPYYDTEIEEMYLQYRFDRIEWNIARNELKEQSKIIDESELLNNYKEILKLDKEELNRMSSYTQAQKKEIREQFDYDIFEKIDILSNSISEKEKIIKSLEENLEQYDKFSRDLEENSKKLTSIENQYGNGVVIYYGMMSKEDLEYYLTLLEEQESIINKLININRKLATDIGVSQDFEDSINQLNQFLNLIQDSISNVENELENR